MLRHSPPETQAKAQKQMDQPQIYQPRAIVLQCANFYRHLSYLPSRLPQAVVQDQEGALLINSGLPTDTLNKIAHPLLADEQNLPERLQQLASQFGDLPFAWLLGPDTQPQNLGEHLESLGYEQTETLLGMTLELGELPSPAPRPDLTDLAKLRLTWAETEEQISGYAQLLADLWNPPDTALVSAYAACAQNILRPGMPIRFALAYAEDSPVAGVEFWHGPAKVVGAYGLVCQPKWRNQGLGTALLQFGLDYFKNSKGCEIATLQAAPKAHNLYARLGFKPYGEWLEYAKAPGSA